MTADWSEHDAHSGGHNARSFAGLDLLGNHTRRKLVADLPHICLDGPWTAVVEDQPKVLGANRSGPRRRRRRVCCKYIFNVRIN